MLLSARNTALLYLVCLGLLSACGFSPLYGNNGVTNSKAVSANFDTIYIENIPDREGQYLRNALIDRFYSGGRPDGAQYRLRIQPIDETLTDLDITKSSDATRAQLRLDTIMTLHERGSGKEILKRKLVSITSYNILQSQFTTRVSEDNARLNAIDDLARQIEMQLALFFERESAY